MKYTIPKYEFKKGGKAKVARSLFSKVKKPKTAKSVKSIKDKIDFTGVESLTFDEANAWIKANPDLRLGRGMDPNISRPDYKQGGRIKYNNGGKVRINGQLVSTDSPKYQMMYASGLLSTIDVGPDGIPDLHYGRPVEVNAKMTDEERERRLRKQHYDPNLTQRENEKKYQAKRTIEGWKQADINQPGGLERAGHVAAIPLKIAKTVASNVIGKPAMLAGEILTTPFSLLTETKDYLQGKPYNFNNAFPNFARVNDAFENPDPTYEVLPMHTGATDYGNQKMLSDFLDIDKQKNPVLGFAADILTPTPFTIAALPRTITTGVKGINQLNKLFKPSYMSLKAPKGNMYGQNQVLTQQARLLDPDIKNKFFKNQATPFTGTVNKFLKPPSDYLNRITRNNYEDFVTDIHSKTDYAPAASADRLPSNLGSGNYSKPGLVYTDAPLNNLGKDIINAHEKNHGIFAGTLSEKMSDDLVKPFGTRRPIPHYKDKHQADEVLARMAQFKNAVGIGDNQVFTLGHLNLIRKNYANRFIDNSITDMLSLIKPGSKGEKLFLKNMNKYAFGSLPIIGGGAAAYEFQKKDGGKLKYQLGGEASDPTPNPTQFVSNYENEILNRSLNKYSRQPIKPIHVYKPGVIPPGSEFSQLTDDQKELLKRGNNLDKVKTWYEKYHTEMNPNKGYFGFKDALNEMDHFFDIKKILENQDKEKDNFNEAFQNNKEWYKNWYDKRRQLSNFKDVADFRYNIFDEEFNPHLTDKVNMGLNQWENENYGDLPFPKHHYIPRGYNAYYDMKGHTWYDIDGIPHRNFTDKDGKLQNGLITHEESHLRDDFYPQQDTKFWFKDMDKDWRKPGSKWDPIELIISKEDIENARDNQLFDPYYHYQPTEVRARLNVWRQKNNIDPLMNYSPDEIQNIMDEDLKNKDLDHNIKELYQLLKNNPKYLKFINDSYVSNDNNIPVDIINNQNNNPIKTVKYGGTLKYQLGGEASSPEVDNESSGLSYGLARNSNTDKFNDIANYYFNKNKSEIVPINPMKKGAVENDAQEFLTKMINSPLFEKRYNTMRQKTATPEEVNAYKQSMLNNMDKVQYWPIGYESNKQPWMPDTDDWEVLGYYVKDFYPTYDEYGIPNLSKDVNNRLDDWHHTIYRKDNSPIVTLHELSHASTISDSIPSKVRIPYSIKPEKAEYVKRYTGPDYQRQTEHKAYLDELRKYLYDKKVYDPTQKEFDEIDYNNLINEYEKFKKELEKDPNNLELQYLESAFEKNILPYDKENTIKLFNSFVSNKNNNPIRTAKYGGRLKYR